MTGFFYGSNVRKRELDVFDLGLALPTLGSKPAEAQVTQRAAGSKVKVVRNE